MTDEAAYPREATFEQLVRPPARVQFGRVDLNEACRRYESDGYTVTPWLRDFIRQYGEIVVRWPAKHGADDNMLATTVEAALEAPIHNIRIYSKRLGRPVLRVGMAFVTEERVLLADNGDILLGGDAGLLMVANGLQNAVRALLADDRDKTALWWW
ncbi:SUKH-3 domain-containing protein [Actinoplanes sp. NPDC004185]